MIISRCLCMLMHSIHLLVGGVNNFVCRIVTHACGFSHSVRVLAKQETELLGPGFDLLESGRPERNRVVLRCRRRSRRVSKLWRQRSKQQYRSTREAATGIGFENEGGFGSDKI